MRFFLADVVSFIKSYEWFEKVEHVGVLVENLAEKSRAGTVGSHEEDLSGF